MCCFAAALTCRLAGFAKSIHTSLKPTCNGQLELAVVDVVLWYLLLLFLRMNCGNLLNVAGKNGSPDSQFKLN